VAAVTFHEDVAALKGAIRYPECGRWDCDDDYDWDWVTPADPEYRYVKREQQIVEYHEPREDWERRLHAERDAKNDGDPLWFRHHS